MIRSSKQADERLEAGTLECWCLHGAVGAAGDFRAFGKQLAARKIGSRAVDLWRFLECEPMPLAKFGPALNADAGGEATRGCGRALLGYSMGGRLALHALLENPHPWNAAVIISTHPGLEDTKERESRRAADAAWATRALTANWTEFLTEWNRQSVLGSSIIRDAAADHRLSLRRREIARSFVDWSLGAQAPMWDRLAEIRIPVLWIAGEHDGKFLELARRAVSQLPDAKLVIAPGSGHRVPWEAESWLADTTADFLIQG